MTGYNEISIPVADAKPAESRTTSILRGQSAMVRGTIFPARHGHRIGLLVWALLHCTNFMLISQLTSIIRLLVISRYLLWVVIILTVVSYIARRGAGELARCVAPVMPYFMIGVLAGLIGYDPIESARLLVFWLLVVLAAALGGWDTDGRSFRRALAISFAVMITSSIAFVLLKPEFGVIADDRAVGGSAWRGLFGFKNLLGLIAVYGLMMPIAITESALLTRFLTGFAAIVTLFFASSQGASLTAVAMVGYMVAVSALRRVSLSRTARTVLLAGIITAMILLVVFGLPLFLELLHRDASLTGRSSVWPQWFARAMSHWATGFGPGSFTSLSSVNVDLTMSDIALGTIDTPHNMFIAIFGEVGIFGFFAFILPMLYFVLVVPFSGSPKAGFLVGTIGFVTLVGGISETREVFGLGMNMFLLMAGYANFRRGIAEEASLVVERLRTEMVDQSPPPLSRSIRVLGA